MGMASLKSKKLLKHRRLSLIFRHVKEIKMETSFLCVCVCVGGGGCIMKCCLHSYETAHVTEQNTTKH